MANLTAVRINHILSPVERVLRVLDKEAGDVYPHEARWRLAECAVRHVPGRKTHARQVRAAIRWLRENGHL